MTQAQLGRLAKKWIKKLRLDPPAWKEIRVSFAGLDKMEDAMGLCEWSTEHRTAQIHILEPELHEEYGRGTIEQTLVHELLHLVLQGYMTKQPEEDSNFEYGLNLLSEVLAPKKKARDET